MCQFFKGIGASFLKAFVFVSMVSWTGVCYGQGEQDDLAVICDDPQDSTQSPLPLEKICRLQIQLKFENFLYRQKDKRKITLQDAFEEIDRMIEELPWDGLSPSDKCLRKETAWSLLIKEYFSVRHQQEDYMLDWMSLSLKTREDKRVISIFEELEKNFRLGENSKEVNTSSLLKKFIQLCGEGAPSASSKEFNSFVSDTLKFLPILTVEDPIIYSPKNDKEKLKRLTTNFDTPKEWLPYIYVDFASYLKKFLSETSDLKSLHFSIHPDLYRTPTHYEYEYNQSDKLLPPKIKFWRNHFNPDYEGYYFQGFMETYASPLLRNKNLKLETFSLVGIFRFADAFVDQKALIQFLETAPPLQTLKRLNLGGNRMDIVPLLCRLIEEKDFLPKLTVLDVIWENEEIHPSLEETLGKRRPHLRIQRTPLCTHPWNPIPGWTCFAFKKRPVTHLETRQNKRLISTFEELEKDLKKVNTRFLLEKFIQLFFGKEKFNSFVSDALKFTSILTVEDPIIYFPKNENEKLQILPTNFDTLKKCLPYVYFASYLKKFLRETSDLKSLHFSIHPDLYDKPWKYEYNQSDKLLPPKIKCWRNHFNPDYKGYYFEGFMETYASPLLKNKNLKLETFSLVGIFRFADAFVDQKALIQFLETAPPLQTLKRLSLVENRMDIVPLLCRLIEKKDFLPKLTVLEVQQKNEPIHPSLKETLGKLRPHLCIT